ncbi:MAG: glycosyltransferase [Caldilineales bacterium]|nr:glycosyltransferase [Caldilineales bacterium]
MTPVNSPRVSIITPSYNQGQFIEDTILSVLGQDYANIEHIVVDGGSDDGTIEILQRYDRQIRWLSEPDHGQADAINKGLRMASGDILAYLNSDDTYLPGTISLVVSQFLAHPDTGLIYGDCQAINREGLPFGIIHGHPFDVSRMIQRGEFIPQQAAFWRREVVEKVGAFDVNLHFCMDHDFFIRAGCNFPGLYIPQVLANFRFHTLSKSSSQEERHWRENMAVSRRYGLSRWSIWYWLRYVRHRGLRLLPQTLQKRIRKRLNRAHDPVLYS